MPEWRKSLGAKPVDFAPVVVYLMMVSV